MGWRLARWKPCDGGCAKRSPRFPIPGAPERFNAGDRFTDPNLSGTTRDGQPFTNGNTVHAALWALYDSVNGNVNRIRANDITSLVPVAQLLLRSADVGPQWAAKGPLQWYLDTDFAWPVRTPDHVALLNRLAALGLWDPNFYNPQMDYTTVYPDSNLQPSPPPEPGKHVANEVNVGMPIIRGGQPGFGGQTFHVQHWMTPAERAAVPNSCCHYWEQV